MSFGSSLPAPVHLAAVDVGGDDYAFLLTQIWEVVAALVEAASLPPGRSAHVSASVSTAMTCVVTSPPGPAGSHAVRVLAEQWDEVVFVLATGPCEPGWEAMLDDVRLLMADLADRHS